MGPFEVLVPFVVKDVAGGGPAVHALILAAFGIGGAVGSAVIASLRMPRRGTPRHTLVQRSERRERGDGGTGAARRRRPPPPDLS